LDGHDPTSRVFTHTLKIKQIGQYGYSDTKTSS